MNVLSVHHQNAYFVPLLRPREVVCKHLHASAVPMVCVQASGMVWSQNYEGFYVFHDN